MHARSLRRGSYAIEFALVVPFFLAAIGGVVEYGAFFDQQIAMVGVARDTIRSGASQAQDEGPTATARATALRGLEEQGWSANDATLEVRMVGTAPDQYMTILIEVPYTPIFGMIPTPQKVTASATMRMIHQPKGN